ncbi:DNA-processing protein DprA [Methanohalophilus euhalobius]|uniref:DNA-processing protein DprA n=1 Tax=Methanohalophilus euhalobius TaxID=51203 RepID=UPI00140314FB|nr:DNA-processing protein DprA [Methanohalophilus euhalobius]
MQNISGIGNKSIQTMLSSEDARKINDVNKIIQLIENAKQSYNRIVVPDFETVEKSWYNATKIYEKSNSIGIQIISIFDKNYPESLKQITNPPLLLHAMGNIEALNDHCVAIVGTRKPTISGAKKAECLGFQFAKRGLNVVSGLALGIDASAHKGVLKKGGITAAVLAHGLDSISPKSNKELAEEIIRKGGILLSEYPIGTRAKKYTYIERNRIQSGLSLGTVLVESKSKGGSMKTAEFCKEQGRLLGVVKPPEDMADDSHYQGNLRLILEPDTEVITGDLRGYTNKLLNSNKKSSKNVTLDYFA